jgi:hypothetical protein
VNADSINCGGDKHPPAGLQDQRTGTPIQARRGRRESPSLLAERQVGRSIRVDPEQQVPIDGLTRHGADAGGRDDALAVGLECQVGKVIDDLVVLGHGLAQR